MAHGPNHVRYVVYVNGDNPGDALHVTTEDLEPQAPHRTSGRSGGALDEPPIVVRASYATTPSLRGSGVTGARAGRGSSSTGGGPGRGRFDCDIISSQSSGGPAPA